MADFGTVALDVQYQVLCHPEDLRTTVAGVTRLGQLSWHGGQVDPLHEAPELWTLLVGAHEEISLSGERYLTMGDKSMAMSYRNPAGGVPDIESVFPGQPLVAEHLARSMGHLHDPLTVACIIPKLVEQLEATIGRLHLAGLALMENHDWDGFASQLASLARDGSRTLAVLDD